MFKYDTKLFRTVYRETDSMVIQKDVIALQEWSNKWQMKFNGDECKILHIGGKHSNQKYYMTQSRKPVELHKTKQEKYLVIYIEPELNFSQHCGKQVNKRNQILGLIHKTYSYFDVESMTRLYRSLVQPHLEYGNTA